MHRVCYCAAKVGYNMLNYALVGALYSQGACVVTVKGAAMRSAPSN
jgi:hypothetical protein